MLGQRLKRLRGISCAPAGIWIAPARSVPFTADSIEQRSKQFAIDTVLLTRRLSADRQLWDISRQLARAATSVGANHRAVRRARSLKEFAAKLQVVNEEIDETCYWLDLVRGLVTEPGPDLAALQREAVELRSIFAKARSTTRLKLRGGVG